jgi:hypothetical protein
MFTISIEILPTAPTVKYLGLPGETLFMFFSCIFSSICDDGPYIKEPNFLLGSRGGKKGRCYCLGGPLRKQFFFSQELAGRMPIRSAG